MHYERINKIRIIILFTELAPSFKGNSGDLKRELKAKLQEMPINSFWMQMELGEDKKMYFTIETNPKNKESLYHIIYDMQDKYSLKEENLLDFTKNIMKQHKELQLV